MNDAHTHTRRLLTTLLVAGTSAAACLAQTTEYRMDDRGELVVAAAPTPGSDEAVIAEARRLIASEQPSAAKSLLNGWIEENERSGKALLPAAYLARADATTLAGNEFQALYDYETIIKEFPASPEYALAVERELEIALKYLAGLYRKFLGFRIIEADDVGEELLIRVQERMPGSRLAERAGIELADHYYRIRSMELAATAYELFLKNYPNSAYRPKAMQRQIYASIARFKGPMYDGKPLIDAAVLIRRFQSRYPSMAQEAGLDEALLTRIDESGGQQLLEHARYYLRTGDPVAARYTLQRLLAKHPKTAAAVEALNQMQARGWALQGQPTPGAFPAVPPVANDDLPFGTTGNRQGRPNAATPPADEPRRREVAP
jgi:outer membrane protein assembly factor BamD (BamD/ComL family)